jgi:hypothetical protein
MHSMIHTELMGNGGNVGLPVTPPPESRVALGDLRPGDFFELGCGCTAEREGESVHNPLYATPRIQIRIVRPCQGAVCRWKYFFMSRRRDHSTLYTVRPVDPFIGMLQNSFS